MKKPFIHLLYILKFQGTTVYENYKRSNIWRHSVSATEETYLESSYVML